MPNLLVEIGTEELPTDALDIIYQHLGNTASEVFEKSGLDFKKISFEATPRRIALFVEDLSTRQRDVITQIAGMQVEKAYDSNGVPTQALLGFLKSQQMSLDAVKVRDTPKGKYISVEKKYVGKPAGDVLPIFLRQILGAMNFQKNMRWNVKDENGKDFRFPRPVRWLVALLDKKVVPFQFAGIKASNKSFGHRFLAPKSFVVTGADWQLYQKSLKRAHVILSLAEREKMITDGLSKQFKQKTFDSDLVHITAQLAEEPFLLAGEFSKDYLKLPSEVLASCMKKNQKIFACYDAQGKLENRFVAVLNGKRKGLSQIQSGYENVLESRLKDARYFFDADTKQHFVTKLPLLEQVTYLGKLGNMRQKTERIEKLAEYFCQLSGQENKNEDLLRAAHLSKVDLMTHLVYEFPDLQGIVGRHYALIAGEKKEVAEAIGTQYLPQNLSVSYKELKKEMNDLGAMLGIVDRLDHLVGAFGIGLEPSGSQDPYALRRAGGIFVKIIRAFGFRFSLQELIDFASSFYGKNLIESGQWQPKLKKFFEERLVFELQVKPGTREYEILSAVIRSGSDDLADVYDRYERLMGLYHGKPKIFIQAAKVVERTGNIIKGAKSESQINPELFKEAPEQKLLKVFNESAGEIREFLSKKDYEKATSRFGEIFYQPLHDFFEQVMVNVEDPAIRSNRQALMRAINRLYTERVADLSVLSRLDQE